MDGVTSCRARLPSPLGPGADPEQPEEHRPSLARPEQPAHSSQRYRCPEGLLDYPEHQEGLAERRRSQLRG